MRPTLEAGDTIFVAKWPFRLLSYKPAYGQVVVFSPPSDPDRDYIKRVVGLPGDTVEIRQGELFLNGKAALARPLQSDALCGEERLPGATYPFCREPPLPDHFGPEKVPSGDVFVMSDLRTDASESRRSMRFGMVPVQSLKARALWIWLSVDPQGAGEKTGWFSRIRFERMFQRIQ
jgi:signal peptidase I